MKKTNNILKMLLWVGLRIPAQEKPSFITKILNCSLLFFMLILLNTLTTNAQSCYTCRGCNWVATCPAGTDSMHTGALFGINFGNSCSLPPDMNAILTGDIHVSRSAAQDIASNGTACTALANNGCASVITTEMVSMVLSGGGITLRAGAGFQTNCTGVFLPPSAGQIIKKDTDPAGCSSACDSCVCSFFDIFIEATTPLGVLYNHVPLRVEAKICGVPPCNVTYFHPTGFCIPLYDKPLNSTCGFPGSLLATLVEAAHITTPCDIKKKVIVNATKIDETNNQCNGSATATGKAGNGGPYTYQWSNGGTSPTISGLCHGHYTVTVADKFGCTASRVICINNRNTVIRSAEIANDENDDAKQVDVHPNPFTDALNIDVITDEDLTVTVRDIAGRVMSVYKNINESFIMDAKLNSGLYFINFENQSGSYKEVLKVVRNN